MRRGAALLQLDIPFLHFQIEYYVAVYTDPGAHVG